MVKSAEKYDNLSSSIKQPKKIFLNLLYYLSRIVSVKILFNFIFYYGFVSVSGLKPNNEKADFRKVSEVLFIMQVMDIIYSAELDHLMLMFVYNTDYF